MLSHINPFLSPPCLPNKPIRCFFFPSIFYWAKWLDLSGIAKVGCGLAIVGLSKTPGPWLIYKEQPHASVCNVWQCWAVLTGLIRLSLLEILDLTDPSPSVIVCTPQTWQQQAEEWRGHHFISLSRRNDYLEILICSTYNTTPLQMLVGSLINGQINYVDPKFLIQPQRALNNFSLNFQSK